MWRPLLRGILLLVGVSVLGTIGYMVLEGWTLNEAAYMTAITLTTVGFMEVRPLSPEARDYRFEPGDVLVVLATPEQLDEMAVLTGGWKRQ